ncbi:hypothetical protein AKJ09_02421 [Labilithrix luteola]|uniref:Uncharacterized protein n=2 Tax=Labilithrix luteola TaxID=1391654 RepID=A0A0K1PQG1_9BACT|nr:hypothetical protein AKJ09_02421 [Labilithrix luteola]
MGMASIGEVVLYFASPLRLAPLAVLPLGKPERIPLSSAAVRGIAAPEEHELKDRSGVARCLNMIGERTANGLSVFLDPAHERAMLKLNMYPGMGCALLRFRRVDNGLEIHKSFVPIPLAWLIGMPFFALSLETPDILFATLFFALISLANTMVIRARLNESIALVMAGIATRLETLS